MARKKAASTVLKTVLSARQKLLTKVIAVLSIAVMLAPAYAELASPGGPLFSTPRVEFVPPSEDSQLTGAALPPEARDRAGSENPRAGRAPEGPAESSQGHGQDGPNNQDAQQGKSPSASRQPLVSERPRGDGPSSPSKSGKGSGNPVINSGDAVWNAALQAFECSDPATTTCQPPYTNDNIANSGVEGRDNVGPEPNNPSTLYDSCADGGSGFYLSDESIEQVVISSADGSFNLGEIATVSIRAYVYSTIYDHYSVWYTNNANLNLPTWTQAGTDVHFSSIGLQYKTGAATVTLSGSSGRHAIRIVQNYHPTEPSAASCDSTQYSDNDDLVFQVAAAGTPPAIPTLLSPFDNQAGGLGALQPPLRFGSTDLEGDRIRYQVQIDDDPLFGSPAISSTSDGTNSGCGAGKSFCNTVTSMDTDPFISGQTIEFRPQVLLTNRLTYWWHLRAIDPFGSNQFSAYGVPRSLTVVSASTDAGYLQTTTAQFETDLVTGSSVTDRSGGAVELDAGFGLFDEFADNGYSINPVWTVQGGSFTAASGALESTGSGASGVHDRISSPMPIDLSKHFTTWEFSWRHEAADSLDSIMSFYTASNSPLVAKQSGVNGYFVQANSNTYSGPYVGLSWQTGSSANWFIGPVSFSGGTGWHSGKVTRTASGVWTLYVDGARVGFATETTHLISSHIGLRNIPANTAHNAFVDDVKVRRTLTSSFTDSFYDNNYGSNPTWTIQSGSFTAGSGALDSLSALSEDRISTPYPLDFAPHEVTWTFKWKHESASTARSQIRFYLAFDSSLVSSTSGNGYYFTANSDTDCPYAGLVRQDGVPGPWVIGGDCGTFAGTTNWNTAEITRSPAGLWDIKINSASLGSATDTTYLASLYIGLRNIADTTSSNVKLDDIVVRQTTPARFEDEFPDRLFADREDLTLPSWSVQSGSWAATSGELASQGSVTEDRISTPFTQTLRSYQVTWRLSWKHESADAGTSQVRFYLVSDGAGVSSTAVKGYYFIANSDTDCATVGIVRQDSTPGPFIAGGLCGNWAGGTEWNSMVVTRTPSAFWKLEVNGIVIGTGTDSRYEKSAYLGFRNTAATTSHNAFVDYIVVEPRIIGTVTGSQVEFVSGPGSKTGWGHASWNKEFGAGSTFTVTAQKLTGTTWTTHNGGQWEVVNGLLNSKGNNPLPAADPPPPDHYGHDLLSAVQTGNVGTWEWDFRMSSIDHCLSDGGDGFRYDLMQVFFLTAGSFDHPDGIDGYMVRADNCGSGQTGTIGIYEVTNADTTNLWRVTSSWDPDNRWHRAQVTRDASGAMELSLDGNSLVSGVNLAYSSSSRLGIWSTTGVWDGTCPCWEPGGEKIYYDNFIAPGSDWRTETFTDGEYLAPEWTWTGAESAAEDESFSLEFLDSEPKIRLIANSSSSGELAIVSDWAVGWEPVQDQDGDGLIDVHELAIYGTGNEDEDSDNDGSTDGDEWSFWNSHATSKWSGNPDGDASVNLLDSDSDGDGILDGIEISGLIDPADNGAIDPANGPSGDPDGDGLTNLQEAVTYGTSPGQPDSDFDSMSDDDELLIYGSNPADANTDQDADGLTDGNEVLFWAQQGSAWNADSDDDGTINLLDSDADADGISDGVEARRRTNPAVPNQPIPSGTKLLQWSHDNPIDAALSLYSSQRRVFYADGVYFAFYAREFDDKQRLFYVSSPGPVKSIDSISPAVPQSAWAWSGAVEVPLPSDIFLRQWQLSKTIGFDVDYRDGHVLIALGMEDRINLPSGPGDRNLGMIHGVVVGSSISWVNSLEVLGDCAPYSEAPISSVIGTDMTFWVAMYDPAGVPPLPDSPGPSLCLIHTSPEIPSVTLPTIVYGMQSSNVRVPVLTALSRGEVLMAWGTVDATDNMDYIRWTRAGAESGGSAASSAYTNQPGAGPVAGTLNAPCRVPFLTSGTWPQCISQDQTRSDSSAKIASYLSLVAQPLNDAMGDAAYVSFVTNIGLTNKDDAMILSIAQDDTSSLFCLGYETPINARQHGQCGQTLDPLDNFPPTEYVNAMSLAIGPGNSINAVLESGFGSSIGLVHYRRSAHGRWWVPEVVFQDARAREFVSTSRFIGSYIPVMWFEASSNLCGNDSCLRYGSVPYPMDILSSPGSSWARHGDATGQVYWQNKNELISAGSGLLTARETDFEQPGRGLDVRIDRAYVQPRLFRFDGANHLPLYDLTAPKYGHQIANLGSSYWRLDFPQILADYAVLEGGNAFMLKWDHAPIYSPSTPPANSKFHYPYQLQFENSLGTPFRLWYPVPIDCTGKVREVRIVEGLPPKGGDIDSYLAFRLDLPNGICWEFNSMGLPVRQTDSVGNELLFCYESPTGGRGNCDNSKLHDPFPVRLKTIREVFKGGSDQMVREYRFAYQPTTATDPNPKLASITRAYIPQAGPVETDLLLTYTYNSAGDLQSVQKRTGGTSLVTTSYGYGSHRLAEITYPTGGMTKYTYSGVPMGAGHSPGGSDFTSFVVTKREVFQNAALAGSIRTNLFSYEFVDGWVTRAFNDEYGGVELLGTESTTTSVLRAQGRMFFDQTRNVLQSDRKDPAGVEVQTESDYFNGRGQVPRTDITQGAGNPTVSTAERELCAITGASQGTCNIETASAPGLITLARVRLEISHPDYSTVSLTLKHLPTGTQVTLTTPASVGWDQWYDFPTQFDGFSVAAEWELRWVDTGAPANGCVGGANRGCIDAWRIEVYSATETSNPLSGDSDQPQVQQMCDVCQPIESTITLPATPDSSIVAYVRLLVDMQNTAPFPLPTLRLSLVHDGVTKYLTGFFTPESVLHEWYVDQDDFVGEHVGGVWKLVIEFSGGVVSIVKLTRWRIEVEQHTRSEIMKFTDTPDGFSFPEEGNFGIPDTPYPGHVRWTSGTGGAIQVHQTDEGCDLQLTHPGLRRIAPLSDRTGFHFEAKWSLLTRVASKEAYLILEGAPVEWGTISATMKSSRLVFAYRWTDSETDTFAVSFVGAGGSIPFAPPLQTFNPRDHYTLVVDYVAITGDLTIRIQDPAVFPPQVLFETTQSIYDPIQGQGEHFEFNQIRVASGCPDVTPTGDLIVQLDDVEMSSASVPVASVRASGYDASGNEIYSRNSVGDEEFRSYWSPGSVDAFQFPGRASRVVSGLIHMDEFLGNGLDSSNWEVGGEASPLPAAGFTSTQNSRLILRSSVGTTDPAFAWANLRSTFAAPYSLEVTAGAARGSNPEMPPPPFHGTVDTTVVISSNSPASDSDDPYTHPESMRLRMYSTGNAGVYRGIGFEVHAQDPSWTQPSIPYTKTLSLSNPRQVTWRFQHDGIVGPDSQPPRLFLDFGQGPVDLNVPLADFPEFIRNGEPLFVYLEVRSEPMSSGQLIEGEFDLLSINRHPDLRLANVDSNRQVWLMDGRGKVVERALGTMEVPPAAFPAIPSVTVDTSGITGVKTRAVVTGPDGVPMFGSEVEDLAGGDLLSVENEMDLTGVVKRAFSAPGVRAPGYDYCIHHTSCNNVFSEIIDLGVQTPTFETFNDEWTWLSDEPAPLGAREGSQFHRSAQSGGAQWHRFIKHPLEEPLFDHATDDVIVQWVRVTSSTMPQEIAIAFHWQGCLPDECWTVAYWGGVLVDRDQNHANGGKLFEGIFNAAKFYNPNDPAKAPFWAGPLTGLRPNVWTALVIPSSFDPLEGITSAGVVDGIAFGLLGGSADWDYTYHIPESYFGLMEADEHLGITVASVSGLPDDPYTYVDLVDESGCRRATGSLAPMRETFLDLADFQFEIFCGFDNYAERKTEDLLLRRSRLVTTYPFTGSLVFRVANVEYQSPLMHFWGGDRIEYDASRNLFCDRPCDHKPTGELRAPDLQRSSFGSARMLGTLSFQADKYSGDTSRVESYIYYQDHASQLSQDLVASTEYRGLPKAILDVSRSTTGQVAISRETNAEFNQKSQNGKIGSYGLPTLVKNADNERLELSYGPAPGMFAFLEFERRCKTDCVKEFLITDYSVDPKSGRTNSISDAQSAAKLTPDQTMRFEYDLMGRVTKTRTELAAGPFEEFVTDYDTFCCDRIKTSGSLIPSMVMLNGVGEVIQVDRLDSGGGTYSSEFYERDDWDRVVKSTVPRGASGTVSYSSDYDSLGRLVQTTNPESVAADLNLARIQYDDAERMVRNIDQEGRTSETVADAAGRAVWFRELCPDCATIPGEPYFTSVHAYYDGVGRLVISEDPMSKLTRLGYDSLGNLVRIDYPDQSCETRAYSPAGLMTSRFLYPAQPISNCIDPNSEEGLFESNFYRYDSFGRQCLSHSKRGANYHIASRTTFDENGRPKSIETSDSPINPTCTAGLTSPTTRLTYQYDGYGRTTSEKMDILPGSFVGASITREMKYQYNSHGLMSKVSYPRTTAGLFMEVDYTYDQFDRIQEIKTSGSNVARAGFAYNKDDTRSQLDYYSGAGGTPVASVKYQYHASGQVFKIVQCKQVGSNCEDRFKLETMYDDVGFLLTETETTLPTTSTPDNERTFFYDGAKRLVQVNEEPLSGPAGVNFRYKFKYDSAGNIQERLDDDIEHGTSKFTEYYYDYETGDPHPNNNLVRTTVTVGEDAVDTAYARDAAGRVVRMCEGVTDCAQVSPKVHDYDYCPASMLREYKVNSISISRYLYDGEGRRVYENHPNLPPPPYTLSVYQGIRPMHEEFDDPITPDPVRETNYVYAGGDVVFEINAVTTTIAPRFYVKDQIGSVRFVLNSAGNEEAYLSYDPFGEKKEYTRTGGAKDVRPKFTGGIRDSVEVGPSVFAGTGFYNFHKRNYDPVTARFTARDPISVYAAGGQSLNLFTYVTNNPINMVDPTGMLQARGPSACGMAVGAVAFALSSVVFGLLYDDLTSRSKSQYIYRNADSRERPDEWTPRPGIDDDGLSAFDSVERAKAHNPGNKKTWAIDQTKFYVLMARYTTDEPGHLSIRPLNLGNIPEWQSYYGERNKRGDVSHYTTELKAAIVGRV